MNDRIPSVPQFGWEMESPGSRECAEQSEGGHGLRMKGDEITGETIHMNCNGYHRIQSNMKYQTKR
ncbi:hypothetical protein PRIPAC_80099 [Pristionchus pacificus]|uniref:Uncharacterized protein n=1 Tax=Pristionchus pacificus TaxID=54126 RepID=A0A2A6C2S8_PRIPA|nr:hypothetical protein PRIPAC_80099 [Pristionchus pacificus]|eukprot:PDM72440.1 hypothetical protein PRIPAC_38874 [Pristionchus pacificus]